MKLTPPAGTASNTAFKYSVSILLAPAEASGFKLQVIGQVANLSWPPALYVTAQFVVFLADDLFTNFKIFPSYVIKKAENKSQLSFISDFSYM